MSKKKENQKQGQPDGKYNRMQSSGKDEPSILKTNRLDGRYNGKITPEPPSPQTDDRGSRP